MKAALVLLFVSSVVGHGILLCPSARGDIFEISKHLAAYGDANRFGAKLSPWNPPVADLNNCAAATTPGNVVATYSAGSNVTVQIPPISNILSSYWKPDRITMDG